MDPKKYYEILGLEVDENLSDLAIKRAYNKKVKEYHPDLNKNDTEKIKKFNQITEAYENLKTAELRKKYSNYGTGNPFENFNNWIKSPINLVLFILLFFFVVHHSTLGMLNIFEDYIQSKKRRKFLSFSLKTISFFVLVISILSVWHIYSKVI